ncbi:MAG TPA: 2-phosphosulfolactate phosphatase [Actinomycetota bacterium]|nr:2-phosphosulfolactate phosphatase [Actinomycetota bacterium]
MGIFDQAGWQVRFEWGLEGVEALAPISDVLIVVDVLRFTTTVSAAIEQGAIIYPYQWKDASVDDFAIRVGALTVEASAHRGYSLSPLSMNKIPRGTRLVLPSPNGSAASFAAQRVSKVVLAGCLRNAKAVAEAAQKLGESIAVIAAGERWKESGTLRPAVEDLVGAGAILSYLGQTKSPEALVAESTFYSVRNRIQEFLLQSSSGRELTVMGRGDDIEFASAIDASKAVPVLSGEAFVRWESEEQA